MSNNSSSNVVSLMARGGALSALQPTPTHASVDPSTARVERDHGVASANGFAFSDKLWFQMGTAPSPEDDARGLELARREQLQHGQKPTARQICTELIDRIASERRMDLVPVSLSNVRMTRKGLIALDRAAERRELDGTDYRATRFPTTERAFNTMFSRFPCNGAHAYLSSCPVLLRSVNFNHWAEIIGERERASGGKALQVVMRTRINPGDTHRNVFAAVSDRYTAFDGDRVAQALKLALPDDVRGSLDYNGERWRIEALWHTDVKSRDFVTGEIFKAGVVVTSDDVRSKSITVQSILWRQACKNMIIPHRAIGFTERLRHVGGIRKLSNRFEEAFNNAVGSVQPFIRAWGYATQERDNQLIERTRSITHGAMPSDPREALPGIFNGLIDRDIITIRGDRREVIDRLCIMHDSDEMGDAYGVSRASIVNAITRYAHRAVRNPFTADELREQAGALLSSNRGADPAPLPYVDLAAA